MGLLGLAVVAQVGFSVTEQGIPALTGSSRTTSSVGAGVAGLIVACFPLGRVLGSYAAGVAADRLRGAARAAVRRARRAACCRALAAASPVLVLALLFVVAGAFSAAATPAGGRMVLAAFPPRRHGLALGVRQTGIPLGGLIATATLPSLAHATSWRWALVAAGALTAAFVLPLLRVDLERGDRRRERRRTIAGPRPRRAAADAVGEPGRGRAVLAAGVPRARHPRRHGALARVGVGARGRRADRGHPRAADVGRAQRSRRPSPGASRCCSC